MKTFVLVLLVLFAIETYGVYGAAQAKKVTHSCTLEVGPLCYAWEKNAIGKILGDKNADDLEDAFRKAKAQWQEQVADRASKAKDTGGGVEKALKDAAKTIGETLEDAKDKLKDLSDK
jgi:hypothetical protein